MSIPQEHMRIGWYTAKLYKVSSDLDTQNIPECTSPVSDTKAIGKVMKHWERDHEKCKGCFKCNESIAQKEMDFDNNIIVIKVDQSMKTEDLHLLHENIVEQKKSGVIVLPPGLRASLAPKDVEIEIENGGGSHVRSL